MNFYKEGKAILEAVKGESESLQEIKVRGEDASLEKHVPQVKIEGNIVTVTVGSILHPMEENHYIEFIEIETKNGIQRRYLKPGDKPEAKFVLINDEFVKAYESCNLHGMWDGK